VLHDTYKRPVDWKFTSGDWPDGPGDRFGPKMFCCDLQTERAPIDVLSDVAQVLTQLQSVQAWNPNPTMRAAPDDAAISFTAIGTYTWDNSPHIRESDGQIQMVQSLTGQHQSGVGQVQLQCTAATQVTLRLSFSETSRPMWTRYQAEAHVARTILELGQVLADAYKWPVDWKFTSGDWLENQPIETPAGAILLRRHG